MSVEDEVRSAVEELRQRFGANALLLFAMGLRLGTDEHEDLRRDDLLDGHGDKKVDFFHIAWDTGCAIVAQAYDAVSPKAKEPPAGKAADLNTALSWLLDSDLADIPRPDVRAAAQQLRDALDSGDVHTLEVYYVHNLRSSGNVDAELRTVRASLLKRLEARQGRIARPIDATVSQLGLPEVIALYEARHSPIRIQDQLTIPSDVDPQVVTGANWRSACVTVPAESLVGLVGQYGQTLFSANLRDYLGERAHTSNINRRIAETAIDAPDNFWVFNNGITLITRKFESLGDSLECRGLAVINGAQTLGSLYEASTRGPVSQVKVLVRVVESGDGQLIQDIIRYNNTQNPIKPWELRVLDPCQQRIARDFRTCLSITYQLRRGGGRRAAQDVHFEKLALWLNSFYGNPIRSHRNSREVFDNDIVYRSLFSDSTDVRHLLFVYRLGEAVAATKDEYRALVQEGTASNTHETLYSYFRYGVFTHVALHLCAELLAEVFGGGADVKKRLCLSDDIANDRDGAVNTLTRHVKFVLAPVPSQLKGADAYDKLRSTGGIETLSDSVRANLRQMEALTPEVINKLKQGVSNL